MTDDFVYVSKNFSPSLSSQDDSENQIFDEQEGPGFSKDSIIVPSDSYDSINAFMDQIHISDEEQKLKLLKKNRSNIENENKINDEFKLNGNQNDAKITKDHLNKIEEPKTPQPSSTTSENLSTSASSFSDATIRDHPSGRENVDRKAVYVEDKNLEQQKNNLESIPDWHKEEWKQHRKHIFILSYAGKPIYTRHGDEDEQASLFGILLTLSQFLQNSQISNKDILKCVSAGNHRVVFLARDHMILVMACRSLPHEAPEPIHSLILQLTYVYHQVVSVLSYSRLKSVFEQRPNFDLRRLLSGSEKFIDSLMERMDSEPGFLLSAVRCLPLENSLRETLATSIVQNIKIKDLVFGILITDHQLICLVRMKQFLLHPMDLHLLFNLVSSSQSFKLTETWTPICLPKFDPNGYLHCHISYLDEDCRICLLLLSVNKDHFYILNECKKKIKEKLVKNNSLKQLESAIPPSIPSPSYSPSSSTSPSSSSSLSTYNLFPNSGYSVSDTNILGVLHFIYKARSTGQYTQPNYSHPFTSPLEKERLFSLYRYIYCLAHSPTRNLKIYYHMGSTETSLFWMASSFELFAVFSPLVSKTTAIQLINKLFKWIKKEENKLFILHSHTI